VEMIATIQQPTSGPPTEEFQIIPSPIVRPTTTTDLLELEPLERSAASLFRETDRAWVADQEPTTAEVHLEAIAAGLHWLALTEEIVAGFVFSRRIEWSLYVTELVVARPYQRQGIGRLLMATMEEHARGIGATQITLTTYRDLPWNAPFYRRLGFLEPSVMPVHLTNLLRREAKHGHDPALRCGMVKMLL
jgi:GNAT superfamily N-acetyltransferase